MTSRVGPASADVCKMDQAQSFAVKHSQLFQQSLLPYTLLRLYIEHTMQNCLDASELGSTFKNILQNCLDASNCECTLLGLTVEKHGDCIRQEI